ADVQTITDLAIFPFIRQFAFVDKDAFDSLPYPHLQNWLELNLQSNIFQNVMNKYDRWQTSDEKIYFA
ncbi:MAG: glutathione S-transferase, partial [Kordiimonadaceae bacterium]|nr:glutathione S-transferase [Kordiimonadaceae bacterium]